MTLLYIALLVIICWWPMWFGNTLLQLMGFHFRRGDWQWSIGYAIWYTIWLTLIVVIGIAWFTKETV